MRKKILISAGGTGGHIFPALAVAKLCTSEYDLLWVGSKHGIERKIVKDNNIDFAGINISGLRKKGLFKAFLMPLKLTAAFFQAFMIIFKTRPDVIIGFGGYATFPICFIGSILKIPVIIHEQNSVAGLTNKILAKIVNKVLTAYEDVLPSKRTILVGNPVREDIVKILPPKMRYDLRVNGLNVLIIGGSLGATIFNEKLPQVFAAIEKQHPGHVSSIIHAAGRGDIKQILKDYSNLKNVNIQVVDFISNMAEAYANADLIICRAGASTVSEITSVGIASIFVPYPHAVDDHQRYNAEKLVTAKAAKMFIQSQLTVDNLAKTISNLERKDCLLMAEASAKLGIKNSTSQIKDIITGYMG